MPAGDDGDEGPADIVEFRRELARRMATFMGSWRTCAGPACKRHHACMDVRMICASGRTPLTPQQSARTAANVYKALRRVIAEKGLEEK